MGYIDNMKVVVATRPANQPPVIHRRNNLLNKLDEQILCARAKLEGRDFYVERTKIIANDEGTRTKIAHQKRINPWWYRNSEGKLVLELRYANKRIEIMRGKTGIEIENIDSLIPAIELLKKAVENGELDTGISSISKSVRTTIGK